MYNKTFQEKMEFYHRLKKARREKGLPVLDDQYVNHPAIGSYIKHEPSGEIYQVTSCKAHWLGGWVLGFMVQQQNESGSFIYLELASPAENFDECTVEEVLSSRNGLHVITPQEWNLVKQVERGIKSSVKDIKDYVIYSPFF